MVNIFKKVLLEFFSSCVRNDINSWGYILESGQLEPKYVSQMIDFEKTVVICLGHGNLDKEGIIRLCRENDVESDWSYEIPDEELEGHAKKWADMNEMLKKECPKYNIEYIDTSKNRKEALDYAMKKIEEQLNNNV